MPPQGKSGFQGFMARVHAHPQARLFEFLLWGIPGGLLVAVSLAAYFLEWNQGAFPLIGVVIGIVLIGWGLLPPAEAHKPKPDLRNAKSRRR